MDVEIGFKRNNENNFLKNNKEQEIVHVPGRKLFQLHGVE